MADLIAFAGPKGSGKTTAAEALENELGYDRLRFAGPMKEMIAVLLSHLGYSPEEQREMVDGGRKEEKVGELGCTPRHLLQTLGTEWGREEVKKDIWPTVTLSKASSMMERGQDVVIDDCRFPNEATRIKQHGGRIIGLKRWEEGPGGDAHKSEARIREIDPDVTIENRGTKAEFKRRVVEVVRAELTLHA